MLDKNITINSRKYDGKIHKSWSAELLRIQDTQIELIGVFDNAISHQQLGFIRPKTISYEFYWLDRWYNIFRFHEPNQNLRNFYCNVNMPPTFSGNELNYVDLDIDIVVWNDYSIEILDLTEFEFNSKLYNYSNEVIRQVKDAVSEVTSMISDRIFPFDFR